MVHKKLNDGGYFMVLHSKKKREKSGSDLTSELIRALKPLSYENTRIQAVITKLTEIAAAEKQSGEAVITNHDQVFYYIYMLFLHVEEAAFKNTSTKLLRELAQNCIQAMSNLQEEKPAKRTRR